MLTPDPWAPPNCPPTRSRQRPPSPLGEGNDNRGHFVLKEWRGNVRNGLILGGFWRKKGGKNGLFWAWKEAKMAPFLHVGR